MCSCRNRERERWIPSAPAFLDTGTHPGRTWRGAAAAAHSTAALFKASRGSGEQLQSKPENPPGTSRAGMAEPGKALGSMGMGAGIPEVHTTEQINMTILSYLYV